MAQGQMSTRSGGRRLPTDAAKLQGDRGGGIDVLEVEEFGTTTCGGNLVIADGTVGGDARKVAEGARYRTGSG
jgi:hypothetical protein